MNYPSFYLQLVGLDKQLQTISQTLFTVDEALVSQNVQINMNKSNIKH